MTLRTIRELRNGAAPFPAVPSSFVDRNFLGAEIFFCVCVCVFPSFVLPAEPCVGCLDFLSSPPTLGCPRLMFLIPHLRALLPSQIFLATPRNPLQDRDSFIYFEPSGIGFLMGFFSIPRPGETAVLIHPSSQPSLGSCEQPRDGFAGTPGRKMSEVSG